MLSLYNIAKFDIAIYGRIISAPTTRNHGVCGEIPRAHGMRPYIHVNRSPNNLRKPTSDLKLIALTEVSELASESWLRRRSLSGMGERSSI